MSGDQDTWPKEPSDAPRVPAIPMSDARLGKDGQPTFGALVKDATASASTLVRSEIQLAKTELIGEAKKAGTGTGLIAVAGVLLLYASLFFFVFLGFLLAIWLPEWAAFGIVFLILLVVALIGAFVGYKLFRKLHKPEKTLESVGELSSVIPGRGKSHGVAHPQIPTARDPQS
ncbi:MAG: phage holin family protein [Gordonia sp. (in: high G+C Gram-positive bacteria)]|uniref:phage holin family protein n=1 Tax=Gordonia sp. (in: high G+C Gram-positive bacteria) TaxID=84139 RepID=UPI0039E3DF69